MSGENNKLKTLADIVAELRMGDDGGKPAYRIGRPDRVEISMPSREKIRSLVIEEVHISELADWIEAAAKREKAQHGNAAAMREALVQCELFLGNVARHGHPTLCLGDQCTACNGVDELRGMVVRALAAPARNCDVGTAEEHTERFKQLCRKYRRGPGPRANCKGCPVSHESQHVGCTFAWAQMPYEAQEGGADGVQSTP